MSVFKVSLKSNERIYVNGAVLRFDRKTSLEFLNDVYFLLESQVLQPEEADTPLKQLYFSIQIQLMAPENSNETHAMFNEQLRNLLVTTDNPTILSELKQIDRMVAEKRFHEAMKNLRQLYPLEENLDCEAS